MINILIVDDEPEIISLIQDSIESFLSEVNIVSSSNGLDAYKKSNEQEFDLIITDHKMPSCTGIEFINKVRMTNNLNSTTPIIMVSGFIPEVQSEISDLDILFYIDKPFSLDFLIKCCKKALDIID